MVLRYSIQRSSLLGNWITWCLSKGITTYRYHLKFTTLQTLPWSSLATGNYRYIWQMLVHLIGPTPQLLIYFYHLP